MADINAITKAVSGVATTLIGAGIIWILTETHSHDVALQRIEDKQDALKIVTDNHEGTLKAVTSEIADPATGIQTKLNWLHNGFDGLSTTLKTVQDQRTREHDENMQHWKTVLDRLNKIDGDHPAPPP